MSTEWVQIIVAIFAGGGVSAIITAISSSRSSNIKSCISLVDELKERVNKLEDDNKALNSQIISTLSEWKEETSLNLQKIAELTTKVLVLESENKSLKERLSVISNRIGE